jgi:hypothetical protein
MSSHHKIHLPEGLQVIAYRAMLDVPRELAEYVSGCCMPNVAAAAPGPEQGR